MRRVLGRVVILAAAGISLAGCASFSLPSMDMFTPAPPVVTLQLDSKPPGATAAVSSGASCRTPCTLQLPATPGQAATVTYTLDRHLPQTVALQVTQHQGAPNPDGTAPIVTDFDPNPVFVDLQPLAPPKKMRKPPPKKRVARTRPPVDAAAAPPPAVSPPTSSSPFPPPPASR